MTQEVFSNALVVINSVDLSDHVAEVTLNLNAPPVPSPRMGDTGGRRLPNPIMDAQATVVFGQDYDAGKVDVTLFALISAAAFPVRIRKDKTAAISATNPEYQFNAMIDGDYGAVGGAVGDDHTTSVSFVNADGVAPVRDVTP